MKKYLFLILPVAISGCAGINTPKGEYTWVNHELEVKMTEGSISEKESQHEYVIAKNKCKIEALQIPIPAPSCSTITPDDCSQYVGTKKGQCQAEHGYGYQSSKQVCNYSSVKKAEQAQNEVFDSCMLLKGWEKIWTPYDTTSSST